MVSEVVQGGGEVGGVGSRIGLSKVPVETGGLLSSPERLTPAPSLRQEGGEIAQGHSEVGGVGSRIDLDKVPTQVNSLLGSLERLIPTPSL